MSLIIPFTSFVPVSADTNIKKAQEWISESKDSVNYAQGELEKTLTNSEKTYKLTEKDSIEIARNLKKIQEKTVNNLRESKEINTSIAVLDRESGPIEHIVNGRVFTLELKDTSTIGDRPFLVITDHQSGLKKRILKAKVDANGVLSYINSDMAKIEKHGQPLEGLKRIEIGDKEVTIEISIVAPDGSINGGSLIFRRELFDRLFNETIYEEGEKAIEFKMRDVRDKNLEKAIEIKLKDSYRITRKAYISAIKNGVYGADIIVSDFIDEEITNE